MFQKFSLPLLLVFLVCCFNYAVFAQTTQASISGIISTSEKKLQPGASVSVRNESTGFLPGP
ncbi:MAG: hypothetical protein WKI04_09570 [Ferruginibacter sp.]